MNKAVIRIEELLQLLPNFIQLNHDSIISVAQIITTTFKNGNKLLICGNGGSAADAQHFAAEFVNAFASDLDRMPLPAISIATDNSILTSISNDSTFDNVFSRQVEALGKPNDLLIAFSTSGESLNCILALESGKRVGMKTISFTRRDCTLADNADYAIRVPSENTQHIQECHLIAYHVIAELVEDNLFRGNDE